jgi:hypothetical protein
MPAPLAEQHRWYSSILRGHCGYFGMPHNWRTERVPAGSSAHLVQLPPAVKPEEPTHGLGLVRGSDCVLALTSTSDHPSLDTKRGRMRVTSGKSRVRESRLPGSMRAKPNGRDTRPRPRSYNALCKTDVFTRQRHSLRMPLLVTGKGANLASERSSEDVGKSRWAVLYATYILGCSLRAFRT